MALDLKKLPPPISKADRRIGYRIGCEGWATVREAARQMGVSERTVERRIERGILRAYKLDPTDRAGIRICCRSIAEFISSREVCKTA